MTVQAYEEPAAAAAEVAHPGAWRVSWRGVRAVLRLELRQRIRSTKWIVALVVWFVVVGAITLLTTGALSALTGGAPSEDRGPLLFALVAYLVLGLGLVVTPTLTSTAVNGDRNAGTLATLQVTLLSPAEIVLGKLLAAWLAALAFLVVSIPFFMLALGMGGTPVHAVFAVLALIALLLAAVCGMGIGFSALTSRTAGSTVSTFAAVTGIAIISPILFGVTFPSIDSQETAQVWRQDWASSEFPSECEWFTETRTVAHTERTWWLLAINPFVIVADGSTVPPDTSMGGAVFAQLRESVRQARQGPTGINNECWGENGLRPLPEGYEVPDPSTAPIWPWGLGLNLLLGAAGVWTAVRRLSIPQRVLPKGTRVA